MTRVLLHVGSAKTGSTAIQDTLSASSAELNRIGLHYPNLGNKNDHSILIPAILEDDEYLHNFARQDPAKRIAGLRDSEVAWKALDRDISRNSGKIIILSSEYAFGLRPESAERLIGRLHGLASNIEISAYVRDPCEHYLSATQQILKYGSQVKDPRIAQKYCAKLRKFERLLPGKVRKRVFHREWLFREDVTLDLLSLIAPQQTIASCGIKTISSNSSISAEAMAFLQRFNGHVWGEKRHVGNPLNKKLLRMIKDEETRDTYTRPALLPEIRRAVTLINARDVTAMRDTHGLTFPNFDYELATSASDDEIAEVAGNTYLGTLSVSNVVGFNGALVDRMTMRIISRAVPTWPG